MKINVNRKYIYLMAGLLAIIGLGFVIAVANPNPGHPIEQVGTDGCVDGQVPVVDAGGDWVCGSVNDADANPTNEIQTISINGNTLTLSDGGGDIDIPEEVGTVVDDGWCVGTAMGVIDCNQEAPSGGVWQEGASNIFYDAGTVGIGTFSPDITYALHVDGMTNLNGDVVIGGDLTLTSGDYKKGGTVLCADYVFENDYELESIEEHSEFMWKNKHLPAVPKAVPNIDGKEFVSIGSQMQGILEELEKAHIYIEQLNEENEALKKVICANGLEASFC